MFVLSGGKQFQPPGSEDYRNFPLIMIRTRVSQESEHQVPRAAGAHLYFHHGYRPQFRSTFHCS
jgi:hypothetical protein